MPTPPKTTTRPARRRGTGPGDACRSGRGPTRARRRRSPRSRASPARSRSTRGCERAASRSRNSLTRPSSTSERSTSLRHTGSRDSGARASAWTSSPTYDTHGGSRPALPPSLPPSRGRRRDARVQQESHALEGSRRRLEAPRRPRRRRVREGAHDAVGGHLGSGGTCSDLSLEGGLEEVSFEDSKGVRQSSRGWNPSDHLSSRSRRAKAVLVTHT